MNIFKHLFPVVLVIIIFAWVQKKQNHQDIPGSEGNSSTEHNSFLCEIVVESNGFNYEVVVNGEESIGLKGWHNSPFASVGQTYYHKNYPMEYEVPPKFKKYMCLENENLNLNFTFQKFDSAGNLAIPEEMVIQNFKLRVTDGKTVPHAFYEYFAMNSSGNETVSVKLPINSEKYVY